MFMKLILAAQLFMITANISYFFLIMSLCTQVGVVALAKARQTRAFYLWGAVRGNYHNIFNLIVVVMVTTLTTRSRHHPAKTNNNSSSSCSSCCYCSYLRVETNSHNYRLCLLSKLINNLHARLIANRNNKNNCRIKLGGRFVVSI
ncbi:hypothetical protein BDC45DRAFT_304096 [Circinella umbellata]|nr:hypothetical protein BDC45DRAFT_304096 [Circinella umbellata]